MRGKIIQGDKMSLKEKLRQIRKEVGHVPVDFEKQKNKWLKSVDNLYKIVQEEWLADLETEGLISFERNAISLSEEDIGTYSIEKMEICYSKGSIVLEPVGCNIIGGDGRIDFFLKGKFSKGFMLILFREDDKELWHLLDRQNKNNRKILSKKTLEETIEQWI